MYINNSFFDLFMPFTLEEFSKLPLEKLVPKIPVRCSRCRGDPKARDKSLCQFHLYDAVGELIDEHPLGAPGVRY